MLSSSYVFLDLIALNNFIQYSHCQVVPLFRLTSLIKKTSPQSYLNVSFALALNFQTEVHASIYQNESNIFVSFSC